MKLFSACAIVLVVVGHIPSTGFNGPFDMFKPYSFQVASFVFVSGYFYKEANESHPVAYLGSRIKRLLIPLIAINAAYVSSNLSRYHRSPGLVPAISKRRYRE